MKIGHYVPVYLTAGGVRSYVRRVSRGQRERGHEIQILERHNPAALPSESSPQEKTVSVSDDVDLLRQAQELELDVLHFHSPIYTSEDADNGQTRIALVRTMHGHHAYCPSGSRFLARTRTPCPRRYTLTGCLWGHVADRCGSVRPHQLLAGFLRVRQERKFLARCHTIAVSEFGRTQMVRSGYDSSTISVVYNPVPPARRETAIAMPTGSEPARFLFLGRMVPGKGLRWLLEAAAQVQSDVRFEIIGTGPEKPRVTRMAQVLGVEARLFWSDWLEDEEEVFARLAAARALIFPSLWQEPAGLVTSEAAAAGRAVIASRVGGIPEYAAKLGHTLLIEPGDVDALADAIDRLAQDTQLASQLGFAGWRKVTSGTLSLDEHLDGLEVVYARAVKKKRSRVT